MKLANVRAKAFAMPLNDPAYPRGPYKFYNREFVVITYRTDVDALREVVPEPLVSMAETKCAKGRRESVPVGLREKGCEARFIFVLPCRFIFWWRGLLRFAFSGFGFAPEPIAAGPFCWWRADSFRRSSPGCGHDG